MVKFKFKPTVSVIISKIIRIYDNYEKPFVEAKGDYHVLFAHLPRNIKEKYVIVDKFGLIQNTGLSKVSIKKATRSELKYLRNLNSWHEKDMQVYMLHHSIDFKEFFKNNYWQEHLNKWLYEGCIKDDDIVMAFKSLIVPLDGKPELIQAFNGHQIWITGTGTGKSTLAFLIGEMPLTEPTEAGLLGGYIYNTGEVIDGSLNGTGIVIIDESNIQDRELIKFLLGYLEQGVVNRRLKKQILCSGTKALVFENNPSDTKDLTKSLADFIKKVASADTPSRVGRRFALILLGGDGDYKVIDDSKSDSLNRDFYILLVQSVLNIYSKKIQSLIYKNMSWIKKQEPELKYEIERYADKIPNSRIKDFIKGQALSLKRVKMLVVRYLILKYLDLLCNQGYKNILNKIKTERNEILNRFLQINYRSYKRISTLYDKIEPTEKCVRHLKNKFPSLSYRDLASLIGISKSTVQRWLEVLDEKDNKD